MSVSTAVGPACGTDHPALVNARRVERRWWSVAASSLTGWGVEVSPSELRDSFADAESVPVKEALIDRAAVRAGEALRWAVAVLLALVEVDSAPVEHPADEVSLAVREAVGSLIAAPGAPSLRVPATA